MAVLDFPANPTVDQVYEFPPYSYVWDGVKWKTIKSESSPGSTVYVQDTAPVDAEPGSLWYNTSDGQTYILYEDSDSTQWVNASPESTGSTGGGSSGGGDFVPITGGTITGTLAINNGDGTVGQQFKTIGTEVLTQHLNDNGFAMSGWVTNKTSYIINHNAYNPDTGGVKYFYLSHDPIGDTTAIRNPITIQAQGTQSGSLTRKDYTDTTFVKKAGDTMGGALTVSTGAVVAQLTLNTEGVAEGSGGNMLEGTRDGVREWYVGNAGATEVNIAMYNSVSGGYMTLHENGETQMINPVTHSAQGTTPASLVRKDYLDGGFVPKSNGASEFANQVNITNKNWGEQTDKLRTGSINAPAGSGRTEFCDWIQWGHNGGQKIRHTLWCPADNSKPTELWFAHQNNTTDTDGPASHWRVYHQGFAPTALDVGAASIDRVDTLETELRAIIAELRAELDALKPPTTTSAMKKNK